MMDVRHHLQLITSRDSSDSGGIFSSRRVATTASQFYFLFLGRLSRTEEGRAMLDRHKFMEM